MMVQGGCDLLSVGDDVEEREREGGNDNGKPCRIQYWEEGNMKGAMEGGGDPEGREGGAMQSLDSKGKGRLAGGTELLPQWLIRCVEGLRLGESAFDLRRPPTRVGTTTFTNTTEDRLRGTLRIYMSVWGIEHRDGFM